MNRQIKFRGRDLKTGKWVYGDLLAPITGCRIVNYTEVDNGSMKHADYHYHDVDGTTVGQFTGLLDRYGKEIYEGDILEKYNEQGITMHVNYFGSQFGCVQHWDGVGGEGSWYPLDDYCTEELEVIGNIHDNPE